jgi:hypothetical protein
VVACRGVFGAQALNNSESHDVVGLNTGYLQYKRLGATFIFGLAPYLSGQHYITLNMQE